MARFASALAVLAAFAFVSTAAAQPEVRIVSPTNGASLSGPDVTVTIAVSGTTLVPAAQASRPEDLHVHYLLDVDPTPFLDGSTPIPTGDPNIVHSAATSNTFADVPAGRHRVTVVLALANHVSVEPPVAPSVTFTVLGAAPAQLPRTGEAGAPLGWAVVAAAGIAGLVLGSGLRRLGRTG